MAAAIVKLSGLSNDFFLKAAQLYFIIKKMVLILI